MRYLLYKRADIRNWHSFTPAETMLETDDMLAIVDMLVKQPELILECSVLDGKHGTIKGYLPIETFYTKVYDAREIMAEYGPKEQFKLAA
jgi:hypothetical protein